MANAIPAELIEDFLGSAQMFTLALANVMEGKLLEETAEGRLTSAQIKVMKLLAQADSQSVGDVASFLSVSNAAASKLIGRLVRRKYARRLAPVDDRRSHRVALTPSGRQVLTEYQASRTRRLLQVFRDLPPEDLQRTAAVLDHLAASIVTHSARPEDVCLQCQVYFKERCLLQEVVRRNCQYKRRRDGYKS